MWKEIWKTQILCKIEKEMRKRVLLQKEGLKIGQSSGRMSPCKRERERRRRFVVSKRSKRGFQSVNEKRHHLVEASQSGTLARQGFVSIIQMYLSRCTGHRSRKFDFDNFKDNP